MHKPLKCILPLSPEFESRLWRGFCILDTTLCDKVCQWLAAGWWFSLGTPVSSTNKTDCHDITEILLKVTLNTTILTITSFISYESSLISGAWGKENDILNILYIFSLTFSSSSYFQVILNQAAMIKEQIYEN